MDNYRFYLPARVRCFESSKQDSSCLVYSLGASIGPRYAGLDGCTSCDGDSDDDATFSFQTCSVCGFDFGVAGSSFTASPSSSFLGS